MLTQNPLAYTGTNGAQVIESPINPSNSNSNFPLGTFWINTVNKTAFQLVGNPPQWGACASPLGNTVTTLTSSGAISCGGALTVAGLISLGTNTLTTATLTVGTVTIAMPSVTATTRIFLQRISTNSSTALGNLTYVITAGVGFVITAVKPATPGTTETGDTSILTYLVLGGS